MKLTHLAIANYCGARAVDLAITHPITLIAGPNAAGKSSVREAVRHALTGQPGRVALKKDFGHLLSDGADAGYATVTTADGEFSIVLPSGKGSHAPESRALPFVLDPGLFARIPADERRGFLFDLMGVKTDGPSILAKLAILFHDVRMVEQIAGTLRSGFPAAHKEAQAKAREAKAAFKATTGCETWGKYKAVGWAATRPDTFSREQVKQAEADLSETDAAIAAANQLIGEIRAASKQRADADTRIDALQATASRVDSIIKKLAYDEQQHAEAAAALAALPEPGKNQPPHMPCPCCGVMLTHRMADGALVEYQITHVVPDPCIEDERRKLGDSVALFARSVTNDRRDLNAAESAAVALADLQEQIKTLPATSSAVIGDRLAENKAARKARAEILDAMFSANRAAQAAAELTAKAAAHHADVLAWLNVAAALAPDGIPGELLGEALAPFNKRLAQSATDAEWALVKIGADMEVAASGRAYSLLSESEKWRTDAMIGEAVAHLSGLRLLMLDRFDALDLQGRVDALAWLDILASEDEIDTALVFGTLKALPAGLPVGAGAAWIDGGVCGRVREAA